MTRRRIDCLREKIKSVVSSNKRKKAVFGGNKMHVRDDFFLILISYRLATCTIDCRKRRGMMNPRPNYLTFIK